MRTAVCLLPLIGIGLIAPPRLAAQVESPLVPVDSRVRVTRYEPSGLELVGTVTAWRADTLTVAAESGAPFSTPLSNLARLEVSNGTKGHAGTGALIGGGIGAALGLVAVIAVATDDDPGEWFEPTTGEAAVGAVLLTASGAALGALIGALIRSEDWQDVWLP
jgi:hypothetical protein